MITAEIRFHHTVQMAWWDKALKAVPRPIIAEDVPSRFPMMNRMPASSLQNTPPTAPAASAIEWQPRCLSRKLPTITKQYVLKTPNPKMHSVPPTAPSESRVVGSDRTPTAKTTLRNRTLALNQPTVRNSTPSAVDWKTSSESSSGLGGSWTGSSSWTVYGSTASFIVSDCWLPDMLSGTRGEWGKQDEGKSWLVPLNL